MSDLTADYFFQIFRDGDVVRTGVLNAILVDEDQIRGNDAVEIRTNDEFDLPIFDGFLNFIFDGPNLDDVRVERADGEVSTTVVFSDGSSLSGVLGILDRTTGVGGTSQQFILDQAALASVGKSYADIARVEVDDVVDHDLTFADLGFAVAEPIPDVTIITGTDGNDTLLGTDGDDLFRGGAGNDRYTGGAGGDTFVFGLDAFDGTKDRDVILDFNAAEDVLVLEAGVQISRVVERNGDLRLHLEGDRDVIVIRDQDASILDSVVFTDDVFAV